MLKKDRHFGKQAGNRYESHTFWACGFHDFHDFHAMSCFVMKIMKFLKILCSHVLLLRIFGPPRPECRNSEKGNGISMIPEPRIMKISIFMKVREFSRIQWFPLFPPIFVKSAEFHENADFMVAGPPDWMCHETVVIHSPFTYFVVHFHGKVMISQNFHEVCRIMFEFIENHGNSQNLAVSR